MLFVNNLPWDHTLLSLLSSVILTLVVYLFGETIPKQIARKIPNTVVKICVYPLQVVIWILYPVSLIFRGVTFAAKKLFRSEKAVELTEEDFTSVVETNEKHGLLEENESNIIQASFDFADTSVKEVLTPKRDIYELDLKGLSAHQLAQKICASKYSRIPLYYEKEDNIIGILIVKNFLAAYLKNPHLEIKNYLQKPYIVSPSIRMDDMENTLIKGHLINPTGDTEVKYTEGYILVSPQQYENYFSPGDVVNLEWTYPRDYLMDSNTIWLTVKT